MLNESDYKYGPFSSLDGFNGRCDFGLNDGVVTAGFSGKEGSYVINYDLPDPVNVVGMEANIRLCGWKNIQYIAIGYSKPLGFRHIKIKNIRKNAWVSVGFTHQDIIWLLQNGAEKKGTTEIKNIRLFIKGEPADSGARLEVRQLQLQTNPHENTLQSGETDHGALQNVLYEHLNQALRNYEANARAYMQSGKCPMPGNQMLDWPSLQCLPEGLEQVSTYRATWHAQHLPINLLQYARQTGQVGPVFAAKALIESWLEHSFYTADVDVKYAWYDHGTAERQLAFILMWFKASELQMEHRFLERLGEAILQQVRLLDSEAFYAYHQPQRYHNHAWFQDAALLATALAFEHHPEAEDWLNNAVSRFEDQLEILIVRDGGYAIFVENSIGYHHGVQRLAQLVGKLALLSGRETEIPTIANELVAWSDFLRYPDGRVPAQGDTFRLPPRTGDDVRRGKPCAEPSCTILPKAGYAVVKGNHDNKPWMLCLFNTSLSSTHKHEDNCSITLWFDGVEWLTDPSFYSYESGSKVAKYLRSAQAHNCVCIPRKKYLLKACGAKLEGWVEGSRFYIRASHTCYDSVDIVRTIEGDFDELNIKVDDQVLGDYDGSGVLSLVFSDGIQGVVEGDQLSLLEVSSGSKLSIAINQCVEGQFFESCVGLGFMESIANKVYRMACASAVRFRVWATSRKGEDAICSLDKVRGNKIDECWEGYTKSKDKYKIEELVERATANTGDVISSRSFGGALKALESFLFGESVASTSKSYAELVAILGRRNSSYISVLCRLFFIKNSVLVSRITESRFLDEKSSEAGLYFCQLISSSLKDKLRLLSGCAEFSNLNVYGSIVVDIPFIAVRVADVEAFILSIQSPADAVYIPSLNHVVVSDGLRFPVKERIEKMVSWYIRNLNVTDKLWGETVYGDFLYLIRDKRPYHVLMDEASGWYEIYRDGIHIDKIYFPRASFVDDAEVLYHGAPSDLIKKKVVVSNHRRAHNDDFAKDYFKFLKDRAKSIYGESACNRDVVWLSISGGEKRRWLEEEAALAESVLHIKERYPLCHFYVDGWTGPKVKSDSDLHQIAQHKLMWERVCKRAGLDSSQWTSFIGEGVYKKIWGASQAMLFISCAGTPSVWPSLICEVPGIVHNSKSMIKRVTNTFNSANVVVVPDDIVVDINEVGDSIRWDKYSYSIKVDDFISNLNSVVI